MFQVYKYRSILWLNLFILQTQQDHDNNINKYSVTMENIYISMHVKYAAQPLTRYIKCHHTNET